MIKTLFLSLLVKLVLLLPLAVHATDIEPVMLGYTIKLESSRLGNATLGKIETKLSATETGFSVISVTKAQGMAAIVLGSNLEERCEFDIVDGRAVSKTYSGGTIDKQSYTVNYDWLERKVNFDDGESLDMPQGYTVDNCMMPFAASLLKGDGLAEEPLYVIDGKKRRIRGYKLKSSTDETLSTQLGEFRTIKMVLEREFTPDRTFTLWLSPDNNYVPVKMQEKRKSRTTTMLVNNLEFDT